MWPRDDKFVLRAGERNVQKTALFLAAALVGFETRNELVGEADNDNVVRLEAVGPQNSDRA